MLFVGAFKGFKVTLKHKMNKNSIKRDLKSKNIMNVKRIKQDGYS